MKKSNYTSIALSLSPEQWQWLDDMATKYKLSSMSKAMRCCINCVALGDAEINTAASSGGCSGCNNNNVITKEVELSQEQLSWINGQTVDGKGSIEQDIINACMTIDEYTVFGIIRCKSSVAKCEGAQEAMENIQQQFGIKEKNEVVTKENIDICAKDCGCE